MCENIAHRDHLHGLTSRLKDMGMVVLGSFEPTAGELPGKMQLLDASVGILIASPGLPMWDKFSSSSEFTDAQPNPMDRWTKRRLSVLAHEYNAALALPFQQPYYPFQSWAMRATGMKPSPINLLIHPEYGLWFGLRGAMFFSDKGMVRAIESKFSPATILMHPCDNCAGKHCMSACPVNAFADGALNTSPCFSHLDSRATPDCLNHGCAARNACPIGVEYQYCNAQLAFHMKAFRAG